MPDTGGRNARQRTRQTATKAARTQSRSTTGEGETAAVTPTTTSTVGDDPYGRHIFFNGVPAEGKGHFRVECSRCGTRTRLTLPRVLRAQFPMAIWVPVMRNAHYMLCPSCGQRSWIKLDFKL